MEGIFENYFIHFIPSIPVGYLLCVAASLR